MQGDRYPTDLPELRFTQQGIPGSMLPGFCETAYSILSSPLSPGATSNEVPVCVPAYGEGNNIFTCEPRGHRGPNLAVLQSPNTLATPSGDPAVTTNSSGRQTVDIDIRMISSLQVTGPL